MAPSFSRKAIIRGAVGTAVGATLLLGAGERASAQSGRLGPTLEKIRSSGTFAVGARQEAYPFGYLDGGKWIGFSTEIARAVHARIEREVGRSVELKLVSVTSATRIPLLQNGTVDLDAGSTVHTLARDAVVDFSIPFFVTSTEIMVPANGPIKSVKDLAGKKIGLPQGSLDIDLYRRLNQAKTWSPPVQVVTYQDQADGFQALLNGAVQAYSTDGILLAGMRAKAKNAEQFTIINPHFNAGQYGLAMRQNDSLYRHVVNATLVELFESGQYMKLYERYFGPRGVLPFPPSEDLRAMIVVNSWPQ